MKAKMILLSMLALLLPSQLLGQSELKRWTFSLQGMSAEVEKLNKNETKLIPSIAYNFNPYVSAGLELSLPLTDNGVYSSTNAELFATLYTPRLGRFRLGFSPVLGVGLIGAYKRSWKYADILIYYESRRSSESRRKYEERHFGYRWYYGLRPTLEYSLGERWSLSLSYAFWGWHSRGKDEYVAYRVGGHYENILSEPVYQPSWGFLTAPTHNSALRIGFRYSF